MFLDKCLKLFNIHISLKRMINGIDAFSFFNNQINGYCSSDLRMTFKAVKMEITQNIPSFLYVELRHDKIGRSTLMCWLNEWETCYVFYSSLKVKKDFTSS